MAKHPHWFVNAARRTLLTAVPSLAEPDDDHARALLSEAELALFMALSAPERVHAIGVAKCVERAWDESAARTTQGAAAVPDNGGREIALRAALLHDVGKLGTSNNVLWRVLTHLMPESAAPPEPRLGGLAGTRQARRHHAAYGEQLILAAGGHAEVARIVRGHHGGVPALDDSPDAPDLDPAALIATCDELT